MRTVIYDIIGDCANTGRFTREHTSVFVKATEQFREPHHQTIVANMKGEIDCDRDDSELEDGRHEKTLAVVYHSRYHFSPFAFFCLFLAVQLLQELFVDEDFAHRVQFRELAGVRDENTAENCQRLFLASFHDQELGTLRQVEQQGGDNEGRYRTDHQENAP